MKKALVKLLKVKSIITILLTIVFCVLLLVPCLAITQEFMLIYTTIIAFYFGTQTQKEKNQNEKKDDIT